MSEVYGPREEYLERLADLLPARESARVREDVSALILERAAEEGARSPEIDDAEAERRAVAALGPVEKLAEDILPTSVKIPLATRRTFVRLLAAVFACHLLLSIALTVAGSQSAPIPGLLGPLPADPFASVLLGVVTIFFLDTGILLVLFVAIGRVRPDRPLPHLRASSRWTRRGAIEGLVLLGLLAVLCNALIEQVFSVRHGDGSQTFLAPELLDIVPYVNVVLAFFALRHILTLAGRGDSAASIAADALGSLTGSALLVMAATRSELVHMPTSSKLGQEAADVLDNLLERVFLLVLVVGALLLVLRFVRQAIQLGRRLRA